MTALAEYKPFTEAQAAVVAATRRIEELQAERTRLLAARQAGPVADRIRADRALTALMDDLILAEHDLGTAQAKLEWARAEGRERLREEWRPRIAAAVKRLNQALEEAARVNSELRQLIEEYRSAGGDGSYDDLAWAELGPSSRLSGSKLDGWRAYLVQEHLLD
jgi:DNA repair exonuclease SbcCD ATPase subunit